MALQYKTFTKIVDIGNLPSAIEDVTNQATLFYRDKHWSQARDSKLEIVALPIDPTSSRTCQILVTLMLVWTEEQMVGPTPQGRLTNRPPV